MDCKCHQHSHCKNCENNHANKHQCPYYSLGSKTSLDFILPMIRNTEATQFINLLLISFLNDLVESIQYSKNEKYNYPTTKLCNCEYGHPNRRKHDCQNTNKKSFNDDYNESSSHHEPSKHNNDHLKPYEETSHYLESTSSSSEHRKPKMKCHCQPACECQHSNNHTDQDMHQKNHSNSTVIPKEMLLSELLALLTSFERKDSTNWNNQHSHHSHCNCYQHFYHDNENREPHEEYDDSSSHEHGRKRKTRYFNDQSRKSSRKTTTFKHPRKYY